MKRNLFCLFLITPFVFSFIFLSPGDPTLQSYSKFDFVAGEEVIYYEDLSGSSLGDFPVQWNTDGGAEVVSLNNYPGKWLSLQHYTAYSLGLPKSLPENYTLEFDMIFHSDNESSSFGNLRFVMADAVDGDLSALYPGTMGYTFTINPWSYNAEWYAGEDIDQDAGTSEKNTILSMTDKKIHISVWVQKQRLRLYMNESKVMDLAKLVPTGLKVPEVVMQSQVNTEFEENARLLVSNFKVAVGLPDTRNKLLTEGKLVTRGITFDSGSDKIRPESYGILKEIAGVLSENPDLKIQIVGHTDSDGDEAANLALSRKRAEAVKAALSAEFKIASERMTTDGKGETMPVSPNTSADGKANNRRVEFIKL